MGKQIETAQLKSALKWLTELEGLLRKLSRKGLSLVDYFAFKKKDKLPLYRINEDAGPRYIYTDKEWKKFKEEYLKVKREKEKLLAAADAGRRSRRRRRSQRRAGRGSQGPVGAPQNRPAGREAERSRLHHGGRRSQIKEDRQAIYRVKGGGEEKDLFDVQEVLAAIKDFGPQGRLYPALQRPGRNEPPAALGNDHGPQDPALSSGQAR